MARRGRGRSGWRRVSTPTGVAGATFCARDGIADPNGVTMGFAKAAQAAGVAIARDTEVTGVRVEGGRIAGVETHARHDRDAQRS